MSNRELGFNSFNFITFMLLTFNLMVNINNNLNNNNNNNNDNNINALDQNSQNTVTNTNSANEIGVTILPIPGKRSLRHLKRHPCLYEKSKRLDDLLASFLFDKMVRIHKEVTFASSDGVCRSYIICKGLQTVLRSLELDDIVIIQGTSAVTSNSSLSGISCSALYPGCE